MQWHAIAKFTWRLNNSVDKSIDRHTNFPINYFLDFDNLFNCYNLFNNSFNRHFFFNDSLNDSVHVFDGWHFSYLLRDGRSPPHRMQKSFENTDRPLLHGLDVLLNEVIVIQRSSVRPNSPQYPFHRSPPAIGILHHEFMYQTYPPIIPCPPPPPDGLVVSSIITSIIGRCVVVSVQLPPDLVVNAQLEPPG